VSSSASNLSPSNPALATRVIDDANKLQVPGQGPVPLALLTTSGSGLDPHLPPAAIAYQLARVAAARNVPVSTLAALLDAHIESRWWAAGGECAGAEHGAGKTVVARAFAKRLPQARALEQACSKGHTHNT
jgi:K+-transporting ATPase c subunit